MLIKITLVLILIQVAANQIFTRGQALAKIENALSRQESELINLREGQRLLSDELHALETNMLDRMKDLLCTGCKVNGTTTITTTTPTTTTKRRTCKEWLEDNKRSGTYLIYPSSTSNLSFEAYCLYKNDSNDISFWTIILRRQDGTVNFGRKWKEYQRGFGDLHGEFILGLDYIHALTHSAQHELWVELQGFDGRKGWAKYDHFRIGNSTQYYKLKSLGYFSGNISNSLFIHIGAKWTTEDVDNDDFSDNCGKTNNAGWWFRSCYESCLTCSYKAYRYSAGLYWRTFTPHEYYKIKYAHMAIREID